MSKQLLLQGRVFRILSTCQQHSQAFQNLSVSKPKPFSEIPQPKGLPLLGTTLDYTKYRNFDPSLAHEFFQKRHKDLGSIYKENPTPGLTNMIVHISAPEDIEAVYRHEQKWPFRPVLEPIERGRNLNNMNPGIINAQGQEWYNIRKFYNEHLLKNKVVFAYTKQHLEVSNELADFIEQNKDVNNEVPDFDKVLQKWALECTTVFTMNAKIGVFKGQISDEGKNFIETAKALFTLWSEVIIKPPTWKYFNTKKAKELKQKQKEQFEALTRYVELQKSKTGLSHFQKVMEESDLCQKDKDTIFTDVLGAGVDTTTSAASFVLYCLASNPDKQEILRNEINEVFSSGEEISGRTLQLMKYMHAVNLEAQRLFPLIVFFQRKLPVDLVLSGYQVPAGTIVQSNANFTNSRNPKYFEDPNSFIPERWLDKSLHKDNRFVLSGSFGMGSRMCPGRRFAMQEVETLVISLLRRFKLEYHHAPWDVRTNLIGVPSEVPKFAFLPLNNN